MPALPSGSIILWFGSLAAIPAGFRLCDGGGGSPDLRDKFLVGAGGAYAVDANGGAANHNHAFTSNGHSHAIAGGPVVAAGVGYDPGTSTDVDTGTTDNGSSLPPYHALAYIMKT